MTVKELINALSECDPKAIVIMSGDEEGNDFHDIHEVNDSGMVWNQQDQELGLSKLTDEAKQVGYTEDDVIKGRKAVVLWPT